jgi:hypothetical protein
LPHASFAAIHILLSLLRADQKVRIHRVEILGTHPDNLSKAGWSWGCVSAIDSNGRTIWMQTRIATMASGSLYGQMKS